MLKPEHNSKFVILDREARSTDPLGGKARAFAVLRKHDLPIPPWFVITPDAFEDGHLKHEAELDVAAALMELCAGGQNVAVRSSAMEEDDAQHSFAGQLDTFLFVAESDVCARATDVFRSAFSERVQGYRREHGITGPMRPPAVLVQRMVRASVAGVAFSADPVSGRRGVAVVAAAYGVAANLVSGECNSDVYRVDRDNNVVSREIADKRFAGGQGADSATLGTSRVPHLEAQRPALTDEQAVAVAELARKTEDVFARPQDIEWAIEDARLYLLQSRPITGVASLPDPDGAFVLWDNSNIVESYGGITTPLTFSFIRGVYEEVYRQFCRIMGVSESTIAENRPVFARMVGLIRGRVYYNLLNWYRLLAMLPGYKLNRRFMEQMMGIKESLPDDVLPPTVPSSRSERLRDGLRLLRSSCGMLMHHFRLNHNMALFYARVRNALGVDRPDFSRLRADELIAYYRNVEGQLLTRWDAPLVNDFFAMIFYGLLRRLTARWLEDRNGTLQNDLLCGEGGMISTEPARRLREMAVVAAHDPTLRDMLLCGDEERATQYLRADNGFRALYDSYIEKFGDRCSDELKLESPTLHEDPMPLFRAIGQMAARVPDVKSPPDDDRRQTDTRRRAELAARLKLAQHPLRRLIFSWVLRNARNRVRDRENLRFERTRVFGRVRMVFRELGRRMYAAEVLEDPSDVFYLETHEIFGFAEGTACCTDLKGLVRVRKADFRRFAEIEPPADHFSTRGMVNHANTFQADVDSATASPHGASDSRRGIGCSPGKVIGRVRIVNDPKDSPAEPGCVLVTERTDPSWILIFPSAAAVLVERGSLLSHSAIVARELGVPTIVSLTGLTRWLKDGDMVEMDGSSGIVTRLERAPQTQDEPKCAASAPELRPGN